MIDHDSRDHTLYFLNSYMNRALFNQFDAINTYLIERTQDLNDENHYNFTLEQAYASDKLNRYKSITQELVTRSLISLRANPRSLPTEIKRFLFIDGELKTIFSIFNGIQYSTIYSIISVYSFNFA